MSCFFVVSLECIVGLLACIILSYQKHNSHVYHALVLLKKSKNDSSEAYCSTILRRQKFYNGFDDV